MAKLLDSAKWKIHDVRHDREVRKVRAAEKKGDVPALLAALDDPSQNCRRQAARSLGSLEDERAVEPLIARLAAEDEWSVASFADALGLLGDERAVEPLIALLAHSSVHVREAATKALANLKDQRAVEPLIALLDDKDSSYFREDTVRALGTLGDKRAVEPLIAVLTERDPYGAGRTVMRMKAAWSLAFLGDARAVEPIQQAVESAEPLWRPDLNKALGQLLYTLGRRFLCDKCLKDLEALGIPPDVQTLESVQAGFGQVVSISDRLVPQQVKDDPFLYRGFFCADCRKAYCPGCSNMQGEICPSCGERALLPAYRPILQAAHFGTLDSIDLDAFLGRRATKRAERVEGPPPETVGSDAIGQWVRDGDVASLTRAFSLAADWDARETFMVAFAELQRAHAGEGGVQQQLRSSLRDVLALCKAEHDGGSYRENCISTAERLLRELDSV